jgi:alkanesulfonate monooxygenase
MATKKIKLTVAYRSGLIGPTSFAQQLNTLAHLIQGRFSLNIVAGHSPEEQRYYGDFLAHDERYDRTEEFLAICNALWRREPEVNSRGNYYRIEKWTLHTSFYSPERGSSEIFIAGNFGPARRVAITQGSCWMRFPGLPDSSGTKFGLCWRAERKWVCVARSFPVRPARKRLPLRMPSRKELTQDLTIEPKKNNLPNKVMLSPPNRSTKQRIG